MEEFDLLLAVLIFFYETKYAITPMHTDPSIRQIMIFVDLVASMNYNPTFYSIKKLDGVQKSPPDFRSRLIWFLVERIIEIIMLEVIEKQDWLYSSLKLLTCPKFSWRLSQIVHRTTKLILEVNLNMLRNSYLLR